MHSKEMKILEYVIGILDILLISTCAFYFYKMHWVFGMIFIVLSLLMSSIILELKHNVNKSSSELAKRTDLSFKVKSNEELTEEDADQIGRALNHTSYILSISVAIILFYCKLKWYFLFPISLIIGTVVPALLLRIGLFFKK